MTHSPLEVVLTKVFVHIDGNDHEGHCEADDYFSTWELGLFVKKYLWTTYTNEGEAFWSLIKTHANTEEEVTQCRTLISLLAKFQQDPQDCLDFVREVFGVSDVNGLTKEIFISRCPAWMFWAIGQSPSMGEHNRDDDDADELLSADDLHRMQQFVDKNGQPRKSKSVVDQPPGMRHVNSHRGLSKKKKAQHSAKKRKRKRKGQKHFPEEDLCGKYEFVKYLGHGSYGHVCEARRLSDQSKVALKKVDKIFGNIIDAKRFLREVLCLRTLSNHEAIVDLLDILPPKDVTSFNCLYLVFEFVDTDLHHLIGTNQFFSELHCQYMLYQIFLSLKFMHTGKLVHRDLKPANILINEDCSVKLCDFGLARGFEETEEKPHPHTHIMLENKDDKTNEAKMKLNRDLTRHIVTRWYRSPEVILITQDRSYLPAIDMWSMGCIMSELLQMQQNNVSEASSREPLFPGQSCFPLSAKDPFAYQDRMDQLNVIFDVIGTPTKQEIKACCNEQCQRYLLSLQHKPKITLHSRFPGTNKHGIDLVEKLLKFDYHKRITASEALAHPFFADVRDEEAEKRHEEVLFDFEGKDVKMKTLRELIVDEVLHFNPDYQRRSSAYYIDSPASVGGANLSS